MKNIIVVTGASSGFGALAARALAHAGHTVYASMRETAGRNAPKVKEVEEYATVYRVDLHAIELDVLSEEPTEAALKTIVSKNGRIEVVVHNAEHMVFGPYEAFTPEQLAQLYDTNVLSTQFVNRFVLTHFGAQEKRLVVWVSSTSARGGTPPYLALYFAAKAAMDSLAVNYASKLARWGIETSIIVPGVFTSGTNHLKNAGSQNDKVRAVEYDSGAHNGLADQIQKGLAASMPPDGNIASVADAIVKVVDMPFGKRPFHMHIDPAQDGCEVVNAVADHIRAEFVPRIGLGDLLASRVND